MSGYDQKTGVFELTATKASYWFRREDVPEEIWKVADGRWDLLKRVIQWQGLEILKDGGNYLHVKATPEQLWEALSGKPSEPDRARHYYTD